MTCFKVKFIEEMPQVNPGKTLTDPWSLVIHSTCNKNQRVLRSILTADILKLENVTMILSLSSLISMHFLLFNHPCLHPSLGSPLVFLNSFVFSVTPP